MSGKRKPLGPVAADESKDPDRFWDDDPCDDVIPPAGFISDMVYYARGREVPALFTIWTSLFALSSALKREVWLPWADERLYTNYYIIVVGPAGIVKKNFALNQAIRVLSRVQEYIEDPSVALRKRIEILSGTVTPEAVFQSLVEAAGRRKKDVAKIAAMSPGGSTDPYKPTSELAISLFEMATSVGKKSYQEGMIEKLLDLYDPQDRVEWKTMGRGSVLLPFTHTTLCALTTAQGFKNSIPSVATSDGFLSRCVVVYQSDTARCFDEPIIPVKAPRLSDLRERLGYIAGHFLGEYRLDPEAKAHYKKWYGDFRSRLRMDVRFAGARSRVPQIILKNALLIHAQRYENALGSHLITLEELLASEHLFSRTWDESRSLISMLIEDGVSEDLARVEGIIHRRGSVSREKLIRNSHIHAAELNDAIRRLSAEGKVKITIRSVQQEKVAGHVDEVYHYVGSGSGGEGDSDE
jgi:hypothetical protein